MTKMNVCSCYKMYSFFRFCNLFGYWKASLSVLFFSVVLAIALLVEGHSDHNSFHALLFKLYGYFSVSI